MEEEAMGMIGLVVALIVAAFASRQIRAMRQARREAQEEVQEALHTASNLYLSVKDELFALETAHNLLPPGKRELERMSDQTIDALSRKLNEASRSLNFNASAAQVQSLWTPVRELKEMKALIQGLCSQFSEIERDIRRINQLVDEIDELTGQFEQTYREVKTAHAQFNIYITEQPHDILRESDPMYHNLLDMQDLEVKIDNLLRLTRLLQGRQQTTETLNEIRDNYLLLLEQAGNLDGQVATCYQQMGALSNSVGGTP